MTPQILDWTISFGSKSCPWVKLPCHVTQRPSLWVEEIRTKDGAIMPGDHHWNILIVEFIDPSATWDGSLEVTLSSPGNEHGNLKEFWKLKNARQVNNGKQMAIAFDGVQFSSRTLT